MRISLIAGYFWNVVPAINEGPLYFSQSGSIVIIYYSYRQMSLQLSHRPGVSKIRGMLSSLGSLTTSWNAEIPM